MTKKFKAKNMAKLDNPMRRKILPPNRVMEMIPIEKGYYIADEGCGIGYFTIPMAKAVEEGGIIYAIDINDKMLEETKRRIENENLANVEIIHSGENDFRIEDQSVDMVFTATVFHELDEPKSFLEECKRVLKNEGDLVILDWNRIEEDMGPPIYKRKDVEYVKKCVLDSSFEVQKVDFIGNSFYVITCTV